MSRMKFTDESLTAAYQVLFPPLLRAAHFACLEHARLTRDDGWPTIASCLAFAKLYGVPAAELAALFGYLGEGQGGRTIWVDALRGPESSYFARQRATPAQARALGFTQAVVDLGP